MQEAELAPGTNEGTDKVVGFVACGPICSIYKDSLADSKKLTLERVDVGTLVFVRQFLVFHVRNDLICEAKAIELPSDCDDRFAFAITLVAIILG